MAEEMLRIEGVSKSFGPTLANKDINLVLEKGVLLGLAGENGSGKSTLASMVCGMQSKDSGKFYKNGEEYDPHSPSDAAAHGIAMVVQELGVVGNLPGIVNMFLGKMDKYKKGPAVDLTAMNRDAEAVFEKWHLPKVPLDVPAGTLSIEQRKIMELARALITDPDFLVLDEISQALSQDNRQVLYKFIEQFKSQGRTILMVTHDLEEMVEICDQIAVLRDGVIVECKGAKEFTMDELKRQMIGREVSGDYYRDDQEEQYEDEVVRNVINEQVDDYFKVLLMFENGITAEVELGTYFLKDEDKWFERHWFMGGNKGSAYVDGFHPEGKIVHTAHLLQNAGHGRTMTAAGPTRSFGPPSEGLILSKDIEIVQTTHRMYFENYVKAYRGEEDFLVKIPEVKRVLKVMDAARLSAKTRKSVDFEA